MFDGPYLKCSRRHKSEGLPQCTLASTIIKNLLRLTPTPRPENNKAARFVSVPPRGCVPGLTQGRKLTNTGYDTVQVGSKILLAWSLSLNRANRRLYIAN